MDQVKGGLLCVCVGGVFLVRELGCEILDLYSQVKKGLLG